MKPAMKMKILSISFFLFYFGDVQAQVDTTISDYFIQEIPNDFEEVSWYSKIDLNLFNLNQFEKSFIIIEGGPTNSTHLILIKDSSLTILKWNELTEEIKWSTSRVDQHEISKLNLTPKAFQIASTSNLTCKTDVQIQYLVNGKLTTWLYFMGMSGGFKGIPVFPYFEAELSFLRNLLKSGSN